MLLSDVDDDDDDDDEPDDDEDDDEEPDSLVVIIRRGRAAVVAALGSTTRVDGGAGSGKDRAPRGADPRRYTRPRAAAAMSRPSTIIPLLFAFISRLLLFFFIV